LRQRAYSALENLSNSIFGKPVKKPIADEPAQPQITALQAITAGGDLARGESLIPNFRNYSYQDNTKEYLHRYRIFSPEQYMSQLTFLNKYLYGLHALGVRVIVVAMPSLPAHRKLLHPIFWSQFKQVLAHTCTVDGAEWHDLTDDPRFTQRLYLDNVHLNQDGGMLLVDMLSDWLINKPEPASQANLQLKK